MYELVEIFLRTLFQNFYWTATPSPPPRGQVEFTANGPCSFGVRKTEYHELTTSARNVQPAEPGFMPHFSE